MIYRLLVAFDIVFSGMDGTWTLAKISWFSTFYISSKKDATNDALLKIDCLFVNDILKMKASLINLKNNWSQLHFLNQM